MTPEQWIDEYQRGKGGIYPHHVAMMVAAEFSISLPLARELVLAHIRKVLSERLP